MVGKDIKNTVWYGWKILDGNKMMADIKRTCWKKRMPIKDIKMKLVERIWKR
jgi:hypothetical protein